jgi:hypothetical protein
VVYFGPTGSSSINYLKGLAAAQQGKDVSSISGKTAPAVPLLTAVQAGQLAEGSVVGMNPAEWLVDLFTQADREGRGGDFADAYDASPLKQVRKEPELVAVWEAVGTHSGPPLVQKLFSRHASSQFSF